MELVHRMQPSKQSSVICMPGLFTQYFLQEMKISKVVRLGLLRNLKELLGSMM
uniref:Uncharacterized protein n=1 Tax=Arundo donax TaxID=35708 RepID=A0A0A9EAU5_ARUDO